MAPVSPERSSRLVQKAATQDRRLAGTAVLGEWVDSSVIFAVVFLNALVGYLQEARAEKAINALAEMVVIKAMVRRDGKKQGVPSSACKA